MFYGIAEISTKMAQSFRYKTSDRWTIWDPIWYSLAQIQSTLINPPKTSRIIQSLLNISYSPRFVGSSKAWVNFQARIIADLSKTHRRFAPDPQHTWQTRTIVWLISIKQTKTIISKFALKPINHSIFNDWWIKPIFHQTSHLIDLSEIVRRVNWPLIHQISPQTYL